MVALVGSLQSELGCPGDWQPECAADRGCSRSRARPACSARTFDVPAGRYEYKVALNGSWDENYGAGGAPGGANIPLTAPGGAVTFTYDHAHARDQRRRARGRCRPSAAAHWLRARA